MSVANDKKEQEDLLKKPPSDGLVVFNRALYTGIGFGVNEASSLWITNQFMLGKNLFAKVPLLEKFGAWFSKDGFERASEWIAKTFKFKEKIASDGKRITPKANAGNALLMVTLISGGTLLILPMKILEESQAYWVKKTDHFLDWIRGNKMSAEEVAARDAEVEQYIACSPKQSWPSMMFGRVVAVGSSIATGTFLVGEENNRKLMNWSEKILTGGKKPKMQTAHSWANYARLLSVETYSCAISSVVLEVMSKLFAKHNSKPHNPEICNKKTAADNATDSSADNIVAADTADTNAAASSSIASANASPCEKSFCKKINAQKEQAAQIPAVAMS